MVHETQQQETPNTEQLDAGRVIFQMLTYQAEHDAKARSDEHLQAQMAELVPELGALLHAHAALLAERQGRAGDAFAVDKAAEMLLWQTLEFLGQWFVGRDDESWHAALRPHQMTSQHVSAWYAEVGGEE